MNFCKFYSGGTPSSSNKSYYSGTIPFIRSGELHKSNTELFISEDGMNNSSTKMVYEGDLLLALYGATSGDIAISQINGAINQAILCINTKQSKGFIQAVWQKHVQKILQTYLQGGQGNLSADIVKNISFFFTTLDEQNKLAKFISILDDRIATQNKIIEKLQSLILGIANQVCNSKVGNTLIKDCLDCHTSTIQESSVLEGGLYPVYGASGIAGYTNDYQVDEEAILIIKDGSGVGKVSYVEGKFSVIGTLNYLTAKESYSLRYLYYCLMAFNFKSYKTGMAIPHIYFKDYSKASVYCPKIENQEKVSETLSKIEEKLNIEKNIFAQLNEEKTYLLQKMFI